MQASLAVAESVWKRVRDPVFGLVLAGGAVFTFFLGLSLEGAKGGVRTGFLLAQAFISLVVIFIGSTEVSRDLSTRNVQFFLSKPMGRGVYLLGKFLGVLFLGEIILVVYAVCLGTGMVLHEPLPIQSFLVSLCQMMLQMPALASLLVLLSVFLPELSATIFGVAFYLAAFLIFLVPSMIRVFAPDFLHPILLIGYYPLPNWQHYLWNVQGIEAVYFLFLLVVYSSAYSFFALLLADLWFRRRDLN